MSKIKMFFGQQGQEEAQSLIRRYYKEIMRAKLRLAREGIDDIESQNMGNAIIEIYSSLSRICRNIFLEELSDYGVTVDILQLGRNEFHLIYLYVIQ